MAPVLSKLAQTPKAKGTPRRSWNGHEEHSLMECVKECIQNGWKSDNSFRIGHLQYLENKMKERCPNSNLSGEKHISSKLTVWKRTWSKLHDMVNCSGFGWTYSTNTIHVDSDDVWINYVKVHPQVDNMRYKNYPLFPDWCEIFGTDRATGNGAVGCEDAAENMNDEYHVDISHLDSEDDVASTTQGPGMTRTESEPMFTTTVPPATPTCSAPQSSSNLSGNKRKAKESAIEAATAPIVEAIKGFMEKSDDFMAMLASKLDSPEASYSAKCKVVMQAIKEMVELNDVQKVYVTARILNTTSFMEMFLNSDESSRVTFVRMVVEGKFG